MSNPRKAAAPVTPPRPAMHDFARAILNDPPQPAPGEEELMVMEILDAIYESACTGAPVQIGA